MGKRIVTLFEILIFVTLFSLFAALVITTNVNSAIIENTEEFVELVRYKGCITESMYYEFINSFDTPVETTISVSMYPELAGHGATIVWTRDIIKAFDEDNDGDGVRDGMFKMNVGDEIEVTVRKPSGSYYDAIVNSLTGHGTGTNGVVAAKGGMILNTQYGA